MALRLEYLQGSIHLNATITLKPIQIDSIYQARNILVKNFTNPPTLIALARQVNLNDCTLKKGFQQIFGTTVFGYLHNYRMEQAKELLLDAKLTVNQVAQYVGYASRSAFMTAFCKKFGVSPSVYSRKNSVRSEKPIEGITEITVANIDAKTVRVTVVGEKVLPAIELFDDDTGLVFAVASATTAAQSPQTPQTEEQPATPTPPEASAAQQDEPIELVVTGEQDGYRVPTASTATKTDTALRDIPGSIQVIPRRILEDQKTTRIQEALENISGVRKEGNLGGSDAGGYNIRGFGQAGNFRNGFADNDFYSSVDTANIERIEVLKGPASVLFGQAEPGGIVNIVTKQPLSTPYYSAELNVGNYAFYRPSFDISGPLTDDGSVLYRLNVAYQNSGSFRDYNFTERVFVAPVITWNISDLLQSDRFLI